MHKEFPSCQRLDVHLAGDNLVYFDENDILAEVLDRTLSETTLTAWFKYKANNPDDQTAKETLYVNFCERYTFHREGHPKYWAPRRAGFGGTIGRMYTVSPRNIEKYHLRLLLLHVSGATSFEFLRTFEGHLHSSFQAAARARGLLADDTEWSAAMTKHQVRFANCFAF